ncbi:NAD(P)/FAD-dependent oxidoreductase [Roseovarius aestuariivivens]|uniref:NAD(P)/FAD-dependent oxidoreductase n=1 Tax=Roseovarius aestuariivivens TaxID=1888910 RepID=UPI0010814592|nr:FAD-binding oxidoreductase [Roseovarius aestuariivivens]
MKRLFPAYTYGEGPRAGCFWPTTVSARDWPVARGEMSCDVAIVGAGYTGLSAALHLAQGGADVILLDAEYPGWGASGRNGGFCCCGGAKASDAMLARRHGESGRRDWRRTEAEAVRFAESLIESHAIECDRHSEGETLMAQSDRALAGFEAEARRIETDLGVTPTIITGSDLARNGMSGPFHGALTNPVGFALNPMKYALGLADAATAAGARIYGHSPVTRIDAEGRHTLYTPEGRVHARRIVIATNGYSSDDLPDWLRSRYLPVQSNVIVTRPLTEDEISAQGWSTAQMCFDHRIFLHYFRLMPDRRMLFGMRGGLVSSAASDAAMTGRTRAHFEAMFPAWAGIETEFSWTGLLCFSASLTPFAGPIPNMPGAFAGLCYHGNGVAMATYAGAILADLAQDRVPNRPYPDVMRTPPGRFPLGRFRRATLAPLYAAAALTGQ